MTGPRLVLTRILSEAINEETRERWGGTVATFPLTKRGVLKAERTYRETREHDEMCWGNHGMGVLRFTVNGRNVTHEIDYVGGDAPYAEKVAQRLAALA